MRIVHLANFFGPRSGGLRTTMNELARGYVAAGHEPVQLVPGAELSDELTPLGRRITLRAPTVPGTGGYRVITDLAAVRAVLAELAPDVVEVSDRTTLLGVGSWARRAGVPSTVMVHERVDRLLRQHLGAGPWRAVADVWNRRLVSSFDTMVATTAFAAAELDRIGAASVRVPLGVDLATFRPQHHDPVLRDQLAMGHDVLLAHCGRLSSEKHPEQSVAVLRELRARGVDAALVVAGSGPREAALRRAAAGLPVTFLGFVSGRDALARLLATADLSIAPGPHETFGLAALESLACGTPVVVSSRSALPEVVGCAGMAGQTVAEMADAAGHILRRPELVRRTAARSVAVGYPWQRTVEAMLRLHEDALRTGPSQRAA